MTRRGWLKFRVDLVIICGHGWNRRRWVTQPLRACRVELGDFLAMSGAIGMQVAYGHARRKTAPIYRTCGKSASKGTHVALKPRHFRATCEEKSPIAVDTHPL